MTTTRRWGRALVVTTMCAAGFTGLALPVQADAATRSAAATTTVAAAEPSYDTWIADVSAVTDQAHTYVAQRTAAPAPGEKLAIVLDIDNTSLASHYKGGFPTPAVPPTLAVAKYAASRGVAVFFVTARPDFIDWATRYNLTTVGYPLTDLYGRSIGDLFDEVAAFKTASRKAIEAKGYTIIANIGNNTTDLTGGHAERTYKLPDYDGLLD